jgi:hypothetical protein
MKRSALPLLLALLALCGCTREEATEAAPADLDARVAALEQTVGDLTTRLDELTPETAVLMAQVQIQHAKLYYSGQARNWELAAYALHEINEALQAVQTFNDQFEDFPTPLSELVPSLVGPSLGELHGAIRAKDAARFDAAFDSLTSACNACHATLEHGFIQVQRPTAPEFTNQRFR